MEEVFLSLGLDIIGLGVFNYDFKSITQESPVIKVRLLSSGMLAHIETGTDDSICVSSVVAQLGFMLVSHRAATLRHYIM